MKKNFQANGVQKQTRVAVLICCKWMNLENIMLGGNNPDTLYGSIHVKYPE
jgi:hypothetical protein